jgi:hypothetical protein
MNTARKKVKQILHSRRKTPMKELGLSALKEDYAQEVASNPNLSFGKDKRGGHNSSPGKQASKGTFDDLSRLLMFKQKKHSGSNHPKSRAFTGSKYTAYQTATSRNNRGGLSQPNNTKNSFISHFSHQYSKKNKISARPKSSSKFSVANNQSNNVLQTYQNHSYISDSSFRNRIREPRKKKKVIKPTTSRNLGKSFNGNNT